MVVIKSVPSGPFATNAYFVACDKKRRGVFIDPAPDSSEKLTTLAEGYQIEAILLTHSHWDHIGDVKKIKGAFDVPLYVHPEDAPNMIHPGSDGLPLMFPIEGVQPEFELSEGQFLDVGTLQLEVIHTPGHTPGGVCFYLRKEGLLIAGDTLFKGSIGNLSFPTANPNAMWASLQKLEKLPPETKVYSGHGPSTTIGAESWLPRAQELFGVNG